jgi:stage V sporulation protein SpoVS
MAYWQSGELVSKQWTVHLPKSSNEPITACDRATVWIEGDCLADIVAADASPIHIVGDIAGVISLKGQCEIVVGGSLRSGARIETEGIVRVFVGEDMSGTIVNNGSATIWVNGNCAGGIVTGHPSTDLHVLGDFSGTIKPASKASLLYLNVRGFMPNALLEQIAALEYTEFNATIGTSDRPPGIYPPREIYRTLRQKRSYVRWIVHNQAAEAKRQVLG